MNTVESLLMLCGLLCVRDQAVVRSPAEVCHIAHTYTLKMIVYLKTCSFRTGGMLFCLQLAARCLTTSSSLRKLAGMGCSSSFVFAFPAACTNITHTHVHACGLHIVLKMSKGNSCG